MTRRGWSTSVAGRDFASVQRALYVRASEYWATLRDREAWEHNRLSIVKASEDDEMRPTREHSAPSDGVEEVQPPKRQRVSGLVESGASSAMQDDDECVVVGSTGENPNIDFAHTRWNCLKHPRDKTDPHTCCDKCFCVICDIPAAQCDEWDKHCSADPSEVTPRTWQRPPWFRRCTERKSS